MRGVPASVAKEKKRQMSCAECYLAEWIVCLHAAIFDRPAESCNPTLVGYRLRCRGGSRERIGYANVVIAPIAELGGADRLSCAYCELGEGASESGEFSIDVRRSNAISDLCAG